MSRIFIKKQKDFDELPNGFDKFTFVEIGAEKNETIIVNRNIENSSVEAFHNSSVQAFYNSSVRAFGNSSVQAFDSSSVKTFENSSVEAFHNSSVRAFGNSSVKTFENSSVQAFDSSSVQSFSNSSVEAFESSFVKAFECSTVHNKSTRTEIVVKDNATLYNHFKPSSLDVDESVNIIDDFIKPSFGEWLERGWVVADGIRQKLVSSKSQGEVTIYKTKNWKGDIFYVAQKGDKFSHAKNSKDATEDLRFKISDRDTTELEDWTLETKASQDKMIEAYRKITGACAEGVKMFLSEKKIKDELSIKEVIELTSGRFGHEEFKNFFKG